MKRKNPVRIGEVMEALFADNRLLSDGMKEAAIMGAWRQVVGETISEYTTHIAVRNHKMYVRLSSSVARSQFYARRLEIRRELNRVAGDPGFITFISIQ